MDQNLIKRYRNQLGISQDDCAYETQISRQAILRAEQGVYHEVLPSISDYFQQFISPNELDTEYRDWQKNNRYSNREALTLFDAAVGFSGFSSRVHPLAIWLKLSRLNKIQFCKLFCVHPATLHRFLHEGSSLPEQFIEAMADADINLSNFVPAFDRYLRAA